MPTASTESVEKKGPVEVQTPIKQAIAIVEKKVRNLEKRKNKLDLIKQKAASGHQLEADQRNAIEHYNEVIQTLEYSRQLQKQFAAIQTEASKMMKKQARRDKLDRQIHEMKRIEELLKVQNLLDSMGSQTVRADFQTGKHGAVVLTEENLNQLDQLYQLISPTREGDGEYHKKVNTAAEHIVCLLEGKQKEVIGTTYKDLKELVDLISGCGYFETVKTIENEKKSTEISEGADDDQFEGSADVVSSEDDKTESQHDETPLDIPPMTQAPPEHREQQPAPQPARMTAGAPTQPDSNTFYANANANEIYPTPCQRPIDEIVSSVQGSFNFLQESTIDVDSAPHIDPAVVAAQPMSRQSSQQQQQQDAEPTRPISGFGSQVYDRQTDPSQPTQPTQHTSLGHGDQRYPQQPEQGLAYTTSSSSSQQQQQPFRQSLPSKSWASQVEDHELLPDAAIAQFESIPPSIPLPQTQDNQQSNNSNQSEKKFTMNVSAPAFQSMYTQQSQDHVDEESGNGTQSTDPAGANYQNNRYQNDGFQQRGSRREGGGFRGRGGRGGAGNSGGNSNNGGGMQNGFNRNSGTGSGQNSGRGGRGSYQGFPPRSGNFQGDGYQGYSNSGGSGGFGQSYKQRGAGGGTNPGQARGGSGGGARGTGGIRGGGAQRGGNSNAPRSGAPRGGSGGGNNNNSSSSSSGAGFSRHGTAQHQP